MFVGKAEYMDDWKTKHLFPALGMIPIDRGGGSASERALNTAARVLEAGEFFGIYPEGTRARDGRLHRGHTGPARLALRTGAPIIPVGHRRHPRGPAARRQAARSRSSGSSVRFGRPIDVDPLRRPGRRPPGAAPDHRRGDVRDPRAERPGVRRRVRHQEGRGLPVGRHRPTCRRSTRSPATATATRDAPRRSSADVLANRA